MKKNPKISIVVPVYNAENYIEKCVKSILNQTFTDFELILVNDASKDASGRICEELALYDSRISVIHKNSGGVLLQQETLALKMPKVNL